MANESYITKLQRERDELISALVAVQEFHEAREKLDHTPYKYDQGKIVTEKREIMRAKFAQLEPLIKGGGK